MNVYKLGDVVRLKSGGPNMTVAKDPANNPKVTTGEIGCMWFTGFEVKEYNFPEAALIMAEQARSGDNPS